MKKEAVIEVNGKIYTLQHPGNREWLKLKQEIFKASAQSTISIDFIALFDYCFEHVVFPEEGPKLKLDDMDIEELEGVWGQVLQQFFKGKPLLESYGTSKGKAQSEENNKSKQ